MINRTLIRTRVLQLAYASRSNDAVSLSEALMKLKESLSDTYDLYLFLLKLVPELTIFHSERQEVRKRKRLASREELYPNRRWAESPFVAKLEEAEGLAQWYNASMFDWLSDQEVLRRLANKIEESEIYAEYRKSEKTFEADQRFIVDVFRQIIAQDKYLANFLESYCPYWDSELEGLEKIECEERPKDDELDEVVEEARNEGRYSAQPYKLAPVAIVKEFVDKTLRNIREEEPADSAIMPMYRDESDERYGTHLLRQLIIGREQHNELIKQHTSEHWEHERLALMDTLLMEMAIIEFLHFPNIPVQVTINEYVELSKYYSTANSASFINGVLDAVAKALKAEGKILK